MNRKLFLSLGLVALLLVAAAGVWVWRLNAARAAEGTDFDLRVGQRVTLGSGLSLAIPRGRIASGNDFGMLLWSKGADSMGRSDYLIVGQNTTDTDGNFPSQDTIWMSVYDPSSLPDYTGMGGGTLIAQSSALSVYVVNWNTPGFRIESHIPGFQRGWMLGGVSKGQPYAAFKRLWALYDIQGTELPPPVITR
jgi:hypothetical protein